MKNILLAGLAAGAWSSCALAADLGPYTPPPPRQEPYYEPVREQPWNWQGLYFGVNAGYGWGSDRTATLTAPGSGADGSYGTIGPDGWYGGGQIGYNAQFNWLVLGLEGDLQYADIDDSAVGFTPNGAYYTQATTDIDWFSTLRGRIGYTTGPTLFYFTGGFAFADVTHSVTTSGPVGTVSLSKDDWETGYTLGGGAEWAFAPNWSFKTEYLYVDLGEQTLTGGPGNSVSSTTDTDFHTVRAGLNYRF
jgi:outer membrane immunogenic protein